MDVSDLLKEIARLERGNNALALALIRSQAELLECSERRRELEIECDF